MTRSILTALAVALGTGAACSVGPDYERPPIKVPAAFKSAAPDEARAHALTAEWWKLFNDPELTRLEEDATLANFDLKAGIARVAQARAVLKGSRSALYPTLQLNPSAQRVKTSENTATANGHSITFTDLRVPFDFAYEVDLWGKVRRSVESSEAQARATADDLAVVLHAVQADVAQTYISIRALDSQIAILDRTVASYRRQVDLLQTQFKAGLVGRINLAQAEALLYSTISDQSEARRQRTDLEHALATLTGRPPSDLEVPSHPLDLTPPAIPAGLPADLLRRRPDVVESEQLLAAASAQIGVAVAQFYPDFTLTATGGWQAFDFGHLPDWQSRIWSIGASALLPLFEGGRLDAQLEQARARYDEALAQYRGRVLIAFRDVEDALTDLHLRSDAAQSQTKAVDSAREYLTLAESQFRQGLVSYFIVIDAERTLLVNELSATQILNQRLVATVQLIKALGAGWEDAPGDPKPE
jgi:multidrug efflux system outer membrane protein